ncbi:hypothetical protein Pmani_014096 [Petrolisthes manimaculis]|uniref:Uncharacterized protein n=1 Tax=Petrolisthes manimaculis TaxID=1843537 RepID=A0AAE1PUZ4_9EUCA|nr:hypothetical protein Pmani_014096 [Petrolisthes manimaculis]
MWDHLSESTSRELGRGWSGNGEGKKWMRLRRRREAHLEDVKYVLVCKVVGGRDSVASVSNIGQEGKSSRCGWGRLCHSGKFSGGG